MTSNLVFGATGAIGRLLLPKLQARGEHVVAVTRQPCVDPADRTIEWLRADLFAAMPAMPAVDTLYSLGPLDAFAAWYASASAGATGRQLARRVIAFSSMSAQTKQESIDLAERDLATRLRAAEEQLLDAARRNGAACTIFRPTLIYGSGRDRSVAPIARFARRWRVLPIPRGARGLRQPVHADDLASACIAARDNATTFDRIYALGGGERLRFDAMLARIAAQPPRALSLTLPISLIALALRATRGATSVGMLSRLQVDLVADNTDAAHDFGFAPRAFVAADVLPSSTHA